MIAWMNSKHPGSGKRLIICCDGTWNTPKQEDHGLPAPTNVYKIYCAVSDSNRNPQQRLTKPQYCYYHTGVGTEGGWLSRLLGGLYGKGIDQHIQSAYHWLARHYEAGDEIYLFGFSRGAFTVRSLGGMLARCGLLDLTNLGPDPIGGVRPEFNPDDTGDASEAEEDDATGQTPADPDAFNDEVRRSWMRVKTLYHERYRGGDYPWFIQIGYTLKKLFKPDPQTTAGEPEPRRVPVKFLGVWDTVGSLGVPDDLRYLWFLSPPRRWKFHDTEITGLGEFNENPTIKSCVMVARQALAVDEMRAGFTPTRWQRKAGSDRAQHLDIQQRWFAGVHADVGGGYSACGLSDLALDWMIQEAHAQDLEFDNVIYSQVQGDPQGPMHNPRKGMMKLMRTRPRAIPEIAGPHGPGVHPSANSRCQYPPITQSPYRPTVRMDKPMRRSRIVYATQHWAETGLYLLPGKYRFEAHGMWSKGGKYACAASGLGYLSLMKSTLGMAIQDMTGRIESVLRRFPGMERLKFPFTLRHTELGRFRLIGVVAERLPSPDPSGSPPDYEPIEIGQKTGVIQVHRRGYLYAYPNDAWMSYQKNRGSVTLTVQRI